MTEAELLFTEILNCDRATLYKKSAQPLTKFESQKLSSVLKRRIAGEPLPYILGKTEFMGFEFRVMPDVLIPRPETEILVETACKYSHIAYRISHIVDILELGTGSGCIAVSLAKLLPNANITATDISEKALKIACYNAQLNNVSDKIKFIQSNLFTNYQLPFTNYDIIISNPPYVASGEIENLQPEIRYEPRIALDGGCGGLDFYRRIIAEAPHYLKENGFLIMEMGYSQAEEIKNILKISGNFEIIEVVKDYSQIERVIIAKRIGKNG